jgi:hypothetical protein
MKIKLNGLFEQDIENGFETQKEYEVNKVEISGDYCAYDVWYYITNEKGNTTCFQDLMVEEVGIDDRIEKFVANFNDFLTFNNSDLPYKFEFKIDLESEEV